MESLLNSSVLVTFITVAGALLGTLLTYKLSRGKKTNKETVNKQNGQSFAESGERLKFAGYEALIKQQESIIDRMTDVSNDREKLIDALRTKEETLYKIIEEKNIEIGRLRHLRDFQGYVDKKPT